MKVPYRVLHQQNNSREGVLPALAIGRLVSRLEVPLPWEAHLVEYAVKDE